MKRDLWNLENHVCCVCFGRIVSRPMPTTDGSPNPHRLYRCTGCGVEKEGGSPSVICACGFKVSGRKNLGLKCEANPAKTPEFPAEFIARQS